ncbi:MAG: aldose 1-epimerase [Planctomycetota bacterium]|nr:aldose 1-epimerase [Planctomycetota bacterium]
MPARRPPLLFPRRNHGCRVETDLALWGYPALTLENELLRVTVLAGKGADLVEFLYKPLDVDFLWRNANPIRAERAEAPPTDALMSFADRYEGGWQELFPFGSRVQGKVRNTEMYFHGEVWALPWKVEVEEDDPRCVRVRLSVRTRKTPLFLERRMTLRSNSPVLELDEVAWNLGPRPQGVMWGHHPAFGPPFLSPDCEICAPAKTVSVEMKERQPFPRGRYLGRRHDFSRMLRPGAGIERMLYLDELDEGWYALVNRKRKVGFGMRWDAARFPVVWIWQESGKLPQPPHFNASYAMALEPFSHLPGAYDRGEKLLTIPAGGRIEARFLACAIPGGKPVKSLDARGRART